MLAVDLPSAPNFVGEAGGGIGSCVLLMTEALPFVTEALPLRLDMGAFGVANPPAVAPPRLSRALVLNTDVDILTVRLGVAIPERLCLALFIGFGVVVLPLLVLAPSIDLPRGAPGVLGVADLGGGSTRDPSVAFRAFCAASCLAFFVASALARDPAVYLEGVFAFVDACKFALVDRVRGPELAPTVRVLLEF